MFNAKSFERVRALLAMTTKNGCTEAEAMTAAAMAAKLMEQHDLEAKDVAALKDERIAQQSWPFASTERARKMHAAGIYVAVTIAEFFDCKCWRNYTEIIFFGSLDRHPGRLGHEEIRRYSKSMPTTGHSGRRVL